MLWDGVSPFVFLPFFLLHIQTTHFTQQQQQGLVFCFTLSLTPFISPPLHQQQPHSPSIPPPSSTIFSHHPQGQGVGGFTSHQHILPSTQSSFNTPCSSHNKSPSTNSTSCILNNNNKERQLFDRGRWNHTCTTGGMWISSNTGNNTEVNVKKHTLFPLFTSFFFPLSP